jgi:two-component system LytT family sensor kinase
MKQVKNKEWFYHLGWLCLYIFWVLVFQNRQFALSQTATVQFCYLIFIAANFYFNIYFTVPRFLYTKKYLAFLLLMLTGIVVAALLRVPLAMYLNRHQFLVGKSQPEFSAIFSSSLLNIFIWVACLVAAKLVADRFRFQHYVDAIKKEKEEAELNFLNAQFNPHFLFNSLNSIYGHIDKRNSTARNMLLTFSNMLRYQLYECNNNSIDIEKEISYIRSYVLLQQIRKEESLIVRINISDNVKGFAIAPLLFIAFIENAFKYVGNNDDKENIVDISFRKEGESLIFKCYNTRETIKENSITHKGIGIANVRQRLALIYPAKHFLDIEDEENYYEVVLKLELI